MFKKSLTFLISSVLILSLFQKSTQQFSWQNNRIVKNFQPSDNSAGLGSYGNGNMASVTQAPPVTTYEAVQQTVSTVQETLVTGIQFDCSGKPTGPQKDPNYCDVYHACVWGKQQKTYACPQVGDRFYYDEQSQKCEFSNQNPAGCPSNNYYSPLVQTANQMFGNQIPGYGQQPNLPQTFQPQTFAPQTFQPQTQQPTFPQNNNNNNNYGNQPQQPQQPQQPVEPWRQYVRQNEQFSCASKQDGFYASKWCNVFYRCQNYIKYEFLCAKQQNGERLWWTSHSNSQAVPQASAQCNWPCDIGRPCTSPGGVLKDEGSVSESTAEAQRILGSCPNNNNNNNNNGGNYGNQGGVQGGAQGGNGQVIEDSSNDQFKLPDRDNVCNGVQDGQFVSNPKYCNVFHVCVRGVRKDFLCAKGSSSYELWWNDATKQCEWPCKLQCSKQIYGSSSSPAEIQNRDRAQNPALCGGDGNLPVPGGNGGYNQFTHPPVQTMPPTYQTFPQTIQTLPPTYQTYPQTAQTLPPPSTFQTQPQTMPTRPPTYNQYNNNNNNFVTIPAGSYGK